MIPTLSPKLVWAVLLEDITAHEQPVQPDQPIVVDVPSDDKIHTTVQTDLYMDALQADDEIDENVPRPTSSPRVVEPAPCPPRSRPDLGRLSGALMGIESAAAADEGAGSV